MNTKTKTLIRFAVAVGLLALVPLLAACAKDASTPPDTSATVTSDATVALIEPTTGTEVPAGTVKVRVETTGLTFTMPSNTNVAGEGHVHFTLDDRPFVMSTEPQIDLEDVDPGPHTLKAELVQNDTKPFDPPIEDTIEFTAE